MADEKNGAAVVASMIGFRTANPQVAVTMFADTVGITHNNADAHATISDYTTFQSAKDAEWKSGEADQKFVITNPKGNTVDMAPSIYLDYDGSAKGLSGQALNDDLMGNPDECVLDSVERDADGNVTGYKNLIRPNQQINEVHLDRKPRDGTWDCYIYYSALDVSDHHACNPMTLGPSRITVR